MNATTAFHTAEPNGTYMSQSSAFGTSRGPSWLQEVNARFEELMKLPANWDHQNASAIDSSAASFAFRILLECLQTNTPAPQIFPLPSGGIQMEWHMNAIDLEIEVVAPFEIYVNFEDHLLRRENEWELTDVFSVLDGPITLLTNPHR